MKEDKELWSVVNISIDSSKMYTGVFREHMTRTQFFVSKEIITQKL